MRNALPHQGMTEMELVSVAALKIDYVVAEPVTNPSGALLCPSGVRLTETVIERLKTAGVEAVVVEEADNSGPAIEERIAQLNQRFRRVDDPLMLQIKATVESRLKQMCLEDRPEG